MIQTNYDPAADVLHVKFGSGGAKMTAPKKLPRVCFWNSTQAATQSE